MATYTLSVPQKNPNLVSPTSWYSTREALSKQMKDVWAKYGTYFKQYGESSRIPPAILLAFTMVESNGVPNAGAKDNSATTGLMQWNRQFVAGSDKPDYTLTKEFKQGRLSEFEKEKLKSFGINFDAEGRTRKLTIQDQMNPELNILIGSIILGQYMDKPWGTTNGAIRMDRIIGLYNWGLKGFNNAGIANKDTAQVVASVPGTTQAYIKKMLGKNGALDIAVNDLKVA